jgi:hypothetical protein
MLYFSLTSSFTSPLRSPAWASFCSTFLAFGMMLFIYQRYLNDPDQAAMDPVLVTFRPLTDSQRRIGKPRAGRSAIGALQPPATRLKPSWSVPSLG